MVVPEQIRKQSEAVRDLYKQINGDDEDGGTVLANPDTPDDAPVDDSEPANSAGSVSPTGKEPPSQGDDQNSDTYAQKWRTLQGMYNADIGRMQAQLRDSSARTAHLEGLLSNLANTPPADSQQRKQNPASLDLVSETDRSEYGDSLDVMRKVSREELYPLLNKISELEQALGVASSNINTVVPQVQRVAQQQAQSAEERFWSTLADRVPDWQKVNNDPNFQEWLLETDPLTGHTRQEFLEQAQRNLDPSRVVSIFKMYGSGGGAEPAQASAQSTKASKTYSPADIATFFTDVRKGRFKGKETERDRIERDIFAAQQDGRIVANS